MTFSESIKVCLGPKYLFKFQGRASRAEFWWFMLFIFLVNLASGFVFSLFTPVMAASLSFLISLILFPANLGVTVRRFHDRNLSGWWLLLPALLLSLWIMAGDQASHAGMISSAVSLTMCVCYLAILCMPSQPEANRFGTPPSLT